MEDGTNIGDYLETIDPVSENQKPAFNPHGSAEARRANQKQGPYNRASDKVDPWSDKVHREGDESHSKPRGHKDDGRHDDAREDSDKGSANGSVRSRRRHSPRGEDRLTSRADRFGPVDDYRRSDRSDYRDRDDRSRNYRGRDNSYRSHGRDRSRSPRSPRGNYYRPGRHENDDRRRDYHARDRDDRRPTYDRDSRRKSGGDSPPEPSSEDSDARTVFVEQLAARLKQKQLVDFFSQVGEVKTATIVTDRVSKRSKGLGYVEFKDEESVAKAIALTGRQLLTIPIIVSMSEAQKNRQARKTATTGPANGVPFHRLYIGNIHFDLKEEELTDIFSAYGELEFLQLQRDENGRSKGFGFVQYVDAACAKVALGSTNGMNVGERQIRVGLGNEKFSHQATNDIFERFAANDRAAQEHMQQQQQSQQGSAFSGAGGRGAHAGGANNFDRANARDEKGVGGASALDDTDVGGVNFNNYSRDSLMRKLARTEEPAPVTSNNTARVRADAKKAVTHSAPSRCIIVKNAYNEAEETEEGWVKECEDDFREECTNQYGPVAHVGLFRESGDGEIYVKFADVKGGDNALKGLNGRLFGGKTLTAQPVVDAIYHMNFPKAANL